MESATLCPVTLYTGDVTVWAAEYDGPPFHAILCDPPYHLTNVKRDVMCCDACGRQLVGADGSPDNCPRCGGCVPNATPMTRCCWSLSGPGETTMTIHAARRASRLRGRGICRLAAMSAAAATKLARGSPRRRKAV